MLEEYNHRRILPSSIGPIRTVISIKGKAFLCRSVWRFMVLRNDVIPVFIQEIIYGIYDGLLSN